MIENLDEDEEAASSSMGHEALERLAMGIQSVHAKGRLPCEARASL